MSEVQSILNESIEETEKQLLEKPRKLNFQPIQEPSINWHESPLKSARVQKPQPLNAKQEEIRMRK